MQILQTYSANVGQVLCKYSTNIAEYCTYFKCNYCSFAIKDRSYRIPIIEPKKEKVISPQTYFQILNILQGAIERGTGKSLNKINYPLAGKTGTTNESKDLWFFGLTPRYVIGVYVGYDTPRSIGYRETGSSVALPIFKL